MAFFWLAMYVDGKKASNKSPNKVEKPNRKRASSTGVYGKFWTAVANLEDSKLEGGCVVASSDEINLKRCALGLDHPYLIISASDLNCSDFGKQLGIVMLEQKFTLCIESLGLKRDGVVRLVTFLKSAKALFDSRMNIIIFGDTGNNADLDELCDDHFSMENMLKVINKENKMMKMEPKSSDYELKLKKAEEKLNLSQTDLISLQKENSKVMQELAASRDEVSDLKTELSKMNDDLGVKLEELDEVKAEIKNCKIDLELASSEQSAAENKCKDMKAELEMLKKSSEVKCKELESTEKLVIELKSEFIKASEEDEKKIEELKSKNLEEREIDKKRIRELELELRQTLTNRESEDNKSSSVQDQETQTDSIETSETTLSAIKDNIAKNKTPSLSAVDLVYKSIRDLKCVMSYSEVNSDFQCDVQIIKGKHIMKCPALTNFSGQGKSRQESKKVAFVNFIDFVEKY